jgi:tetratricopeptide (TPR) repeat protein
LGRPLFHQAKVNAFVFRPDGKAVITGMVDGTVQAWDTANGEPLGTQFKLPGAVTSLAFSHDSKVILTATGNGIARLWNFGSGAAVTPPLMHSYEVCQIAISHDGRMVATGCGDGSARLWDAATGKLLRTILAQDAHFAALQFSPDSKVLLTVGNPGPARIWNTETGAELGTKMRTLGMCWNAIFSRDGKTVTTAAYMGLQLWDATSGRLISSIVGQAKVLNDAAFSQDGQRILIGNEDGSARLWDAAAGRPLGPSLLHQDRVRHVALSPDGQTGLTLSDNNETLLWDLSTLPDDLPRVECWVKVRTGLILENEGQVKALDHSGWHEQGERLAALGGAPAGAEPRWHLDPILFGPDPTARAKALVARKFWAEAEAAYNELVAARAFDSTVLFERGRFYTLCSKPEEAEPDYARAYALGSRDPSLIDAIVASETLLRRTIAESPSAAAPLLAKHGQAMLAQSRWKEAAVDFALELDLLLGDRGWSSPRSKRALEMAQSTQAYEYLLKQRPDDGELWCTRGRYFAKRDAWDRAAADFARGITSASTKSEEQFEHACLRLIVGDEEGYRAVIRDLRQRGGQSSDTFAAFVLARICVQSAEHVVEPEEVIRWAEFAARESPLPWYLSVLGAAYYRAGQFENAIRMLEESSRAQIAGKYMADRDLEIRLMLALAHSRLGHIQATRDLVRTFQQDLKRVEDTRIDGAVSMSTTDWLPLQLLRREAAGLLSDDQALPDDPFSR